MKTYSQIITLPSFLDLITCQSPSKKIWIRTFCLGTTLAIWFLSSLLFPTEAYSATTEPLPQVACAGKVSVCALGSITTLPIYLIVIIFITICSYVLFGRINLFKEKRPASKKLGAIILIVWCFMAIAVILGNTLFCYYLFVK